MKSKWFKQWCQLTETEYLMIEMKLTQYISVEFPLNLLTKTIRRESYNTDEIDYIINRFNSSRDITDITTLIEKLERLRSQI